MYIIFPFLSQFSSVNPLIFLLFLYIYSELLHLCMVESADKQHVESSQKNAMIDVLIAAYYNVDKQQQKVRENISELRKELRENPLNFK